MLALRKIKLRWLFMLFLLPIFAIFAAFGTSSSESPSNIPVKTIFEEVTLPLQVSAVNHDETFWQIDQVRQTTH